MCSKRMHMQDLRISRGDNGAIFVLVKDSVVMGEPI